MQTITASAPAPRNVLRAVFALALLSVAGCDGDELEPSPDEARGPGVALDVELAAELVSDNPGATVEDFEADLVLDSSTVRDIVEGRVNAGVLSPDYATMDEANCPQQLAGYTPVDAAPPLTIDESDEALLDLPLVEACILSTEDSVEIVRCSDHEAALAPELGIDRTLVPMALEQDCWFCVDSILCGWGGALKRKGWITPSGCFSVGYYGCC